MSLTNISETFFHKKQIKMYAVKNKFEIKWNEYKNKLIGVIFKTLLRNKQVKYCNTEFIMGHLWMFKLPTERYKQHECNALT